MTLIIFLKKSFRSLYYSLFNNRIVTIKKPLILNGIKWVANKRYGRAYYKGYYEPKIVRFLTENVSDGSSFLDIGGHAGYFSYIFSRLSPTGKIYTFEPDAINIRFIQRIVETNKLTNIEVIPKGVGSKSEELLFMEGETSSTGKVSLAGTVNIQMVSIDEMELNKSISSPLFMKIDVEGFGGEVLKGAIKTIVARSPTILIEIHENSNEREILGKLTESGYELYNLDLLIEDIDNLDCRFYIARPRHLN